MFKPVFCLTLLACSLLACSGPARLHRQLDRQWESPELFGSGFSGFILLEAGSGRVLFERQADRYFTPASNTKLLTFYTALHLLSDPLPILECSQVDSQLCCRGVGNPAFLHPAWPADSALLRFLQQWPGELSLGDPGFPPERYGPGWAWDDYFYSYQAERSALPLFANLVHFSTDTAADRIVVEPPRFSRSTHLSPVVRPWREETTNRFYLPETALDDPGFERSVPFRVDGRLLADLLADTLGRAVRSAPGPCPFSDTTFTLQGALPADSLYRRLLQESDNFIAEQLILLCSFRLSGELRSEIAIRYALDSLLDDLPDPPLWYDGSGLSRYNLITPRSLAELLRRIYRELPAERIQDLFPAGGRDGTIRDWYGGEPPFVYAKTGTLRHVHCLSGYLLTDRGNWLVFSFMHNQFPGGSAPVKRDMERMIRFIKEQY